MFNQARKLFERTLIGDSVPALVRWGKHVPPSVIREDSGGFVCRGRALRRRAPEVLRAQIARTRH